MPFLVAAIRADGGAVLAGAPDAEADAAAGVGRRLLWGIFGGEAAGARLPEPLAALVASPDDAGVLDALGDEVAAALHDVPRLQASVVEMLTGFYRREIEAGSSEAMVQMGDFLRTQDDLDGARAVYRRPSRPGIPRPPTGCWSSGNSWASVVTPREREPFSGRRLTPGMNWPSTNSRPCRGRTCQSALPAGMTANWLTCRRSTTPGAWQRPGSRWDEGSVDRGPARDGHRLLTRPDRQARRPAAPRRAGHHRKRALLACPACPRQAGDDRARPGRAGRDSSCLIQDGYEDRRLLESHFGAWVVCTEQASPFQVTALDASGTALASIEESFSPE
jgi:hypothetical protein